MDFVLPAVGGIYIYAYIYTVVDFVANENQPSSLPWRFRNLK